ncbi:MAG: radical SAM protein [Pseudomonadota bacterium]
MNILFVYPSSLDSNGKVIKYKRAFVPPLSLAILDSLTPNKHKVRVVNDLVEDINYDAGYDLVAITSMTSQIERAYKIADQFRLRKVKVVIGGIHATALPQEAKQHADSVVIGEADNLWRKILLDAEKNRLQDFYQDSCLPDLKELIIPKWDNMNMRIYPKRLGAKYPLLPIFTTRGCPFGCKFCSVTKFFGKSYRIKPIENVLAEIDSIGAKEYIFADDNIACNPDYSRELFKSITKRNIHWLSQISTRVLKTPDVIDLAAKSGCNFLVVGVESINQASLETVNKGFNKIEAYVELISRMHNAGINPILSFIFGCDEDTPDLFEKTLQFLKKNKVGYATFWFLTPLPGTELYQELDQAGRLDKGDSWSMYDLTNVLFTPKNFSKEQLYHLYWQTFRQFYSLGNTIKSVWRSAKISDKPVQQFFESLFLQSFWRKKVFSNEHPYSGGLGKIK